MWTRMTRAGAGLQKLQKITKRRCNFNFYIYTTMHRGKKQWIFPRQPGWRQRRRDENLEKFPMGKMQ